MVKNSIKNTRSNLLRMPIIYDFWSNPVKILFNTGY